MDIGIELDSPAGVHASDDFAGQAHVLDGIVDLGGRHDERTGRVVLVNDRQRTRIHVVGVPVAAKDPVDAAQRGWLDGNLHHARVREFRSLVLGGQRVGEIRIDQERVLPVTEREAGLAEPPDGDVARFKRK